jgi:hypothetical protein
MFQNSKYFIKLTNSIIVEMNSKIVEPKLCNP